MSLYCMDLFLLIPSQTPHIALSLNLFPSTKYFAGTFSKPPFPDCIAPGPLGWTGLISLKKVDLYPFHPLCLSMLFPPYVMFGITIKEFKEKIYWFCCMIFLNGWIIFWNSLSFFICCLRVTSLKYVAGCCS